MSFRCQINEYLHPAVPKHHSVLQGIIVYTLMLNPLLIVFRQRADQYTTGPGLSQGDPFRICRRRDCSNAYWWHHESAKHNPELWMGNRRVLNKAKPKMLPVCGWNKSTDVMWILYICVYIYTHSLAFNLRGRVGRNQSPLMWPVWLWHTAFWASSWG